MSHEHKLVHHNHPELRVICSHTRPEHSQRLNLVLSEMPQCVLTARPVHDFQRPASLASWPKLQGALYIKFAARQLLLTVREMEMANLTTTTTFRKKKLQSSYSGCSMPSRRGTTTSLSMVLPMLNLDGEMGEDSFGQMVSSNLHGSARVRA